MIKELDVKMKKWTKEMLKNQMTREKLFLKELFEGTDETKKKRILNLSSDLKINILLHILHSLSNGEILMKKQNFELIPISKIKFLKKHVEKKAALERLLNGERSTKLMFLRRLTQSFPLLLHCLFVET